MVAWAVPTSRDQGAPPADRAGLTLSTAAMAVLVYSIIEARDRVDHGSRSAAKAGVGSAINDATRILGGTLGVAVVGSIYASLYASRVEALLPANLPDRVAAAASRSVGSAFEVAAARTSAARPALGAAVRNPATSGFFHGFEIAVLVVAAHHGHAGCDRPRGCDRLTSRRL
jgi:hypothetical protein